MKAIYPLSKYAIIAATGGIFALTSGALADSTGLSEKSWLLGNFTQNGPCKGDGSDPAELKVRIDTHQIELQERRLHNPRRSVGGQSSQGQYRVSFSGWATHWRCHVYPEDQRNHRRSGPRQKLYRNPLSLPEVTAASY